MQLIQLNTWGGRVPGILEFIQQKAKDTDIFCFQEVNDSPDPQELETAEERPNFFKELIELLPTFNGFFSAQIPGIGVATFLRKDLKVDSVISEIILTEAELRKLNSPENIGYYPRVLQELHIVHPKLTILNFHGAPGEEKKDNEKRKLQTERLMTVLDRVQGPTVLTGDFNLHLDTEAVRSLERRMQNHIKNSNAITTRSHHYKKRETMPFADYVFTSHEVKTVKFEVLPDVVSDHLALQLTFKHA